MHGDVGQATGASGSLQDVLAELSVGQPCGCVATTAWARRQLDNSSRQLGVLEMIRREMDECRPLARRLSLVAGSRCCQGAGRDRCAGREARASAECRVPRLRLVGVCMGMMRGQTSAVDGMQAWREACLMAWWHGRASAKSRLGGGIGAVSPSVRGAPGCLFCGVTWGCGGELSTAALSALARHGTPLPRSTACMHAAPALRLPTCARAVPTCLTSNPPAIRDDARPCESPNSTRRD
jgi:hypothetical protein